MTAPDPSVETQVDSSPDTTITESSGINPAWGEAWASIPEHLQPIVRPHFEAWDKQVQERYGEYDKYKTGYEGYSGLGSIDRLKEYAGIAQSINANPVEFYNRFGNYLTQNGYLQSEQPQETVQQQNALTDVDEDLDPRYTQLQQQMQQTQEFLQQQERDRLASIESEKIHSKMQELKAKHEAKYGEAVPFNAGWILRQAAGQAEMRQTPNLDAIYEESYANVPVPSSTSAPTVTPFVVSPTGGGSPQEPAPKGNEGEEARKERAIAMLRSFKQNG